MPGHVGKRQKAVRLVPAESGFLAFRCRPVEEHGDGEDDHAIHSRRLTSPARTQRATFAGIPGGKARRRRRWRGPGCPLQSSPAVTPPRCGPRPQMLCRGVDARSRPTSTQRAMRSWVGAGQHEQPGGQQAVAGVDSRRPGARQHPKPGDGLVDRPAGPREAVRSTKAGRLSAPCHPIRQARRLYG